jgi:Tfp pilus assembly protein PilF
MTPAKSHSKTGFALRTLFVPLVLLVVATVFPRTNVLAQNSKTSDIDAAVQSHFAAAQQAQRVKDFSAAEREYQAVVKLAPNFAEAYMNLGLVYQMEDHSTEAIAEFRRALKLKPSLVEQISFWE